MELKEKQKKILDVAVELFKEKGYMGSSVRDLATRLNIKAASLYAHIRSKEEILEWICFGIAQEPLGRRATACPTPQACTSAD